MINIADSINATGTVYNVTTLIGKDEKGNKTATKNNIYYEDTYEKVNSKWFIAKRISYFYLLYGRTICYLKKRKV